MPGCITPSDESKPPSLDRGKSLGSARAEFELDPPAGLKPIASFALIGRLKLCPDTNRATILESSPYGLEEPLNPFQKFGLCRDQTQHQKSIPRKVVEVPGMNQHRLPT